MSMILKVRPVEISAETVSTGIAPGSDFGTQMLPHTDWISYVMDKGGKQHAIGTLRRV
jgi:hypothetical protein